MPHEKLVKKVEFELDQIDKLLNRYDDLINKSRKEEIDTVELAALASIIHSFYNGIENILLLIAKNIDGIVPGGSNWHKDLLTQMGRETGSRKKVVSEELKIELFKYLAFRHFYRHSYSFNLEWKEMKDLVDSIQIVKNNFEQEIKKFLGEHSE